MLNVGSVGGIAAGLALMAYSLSGNHPTQLHAPDRVANAPLEGGWYYAPNGGCFQRDLVLHFAGKVVEGWMGGQSEIAAGWSFKQHDGLVELRMGADYTVWLKDYGSRLHPVAIDDANGRTRTRDERLMLNRCAAPTPYGLLRKLYAKSYVEQT